MERKSLNQLMAIIGQGPLRASARLGLMMGGRPNELTWGRRNNGTRKRKRHRAHKR